MGNDTNVNIGNAGEYFVDGELERRGFTVAVPMSNVKDFDLLAINRTTFEQFAIQVKTIGYILTNKEINNKEDIRETVAAHCKKSHQPTECILKKVSIENSEY